MADAHPWLVIRPEALVGYLPTRLGAQGGRSHEEVGTPADPCPARICDTALRILTEGNASEFLPAPILPKFDLVVFAFDCPSRWPPGWSVFSAVIAWLGPAFLARRPFHPAVSRRYWQ